MYSHSLDWRHDLMRWILLGLLALTACSSPKPPVNPMADAPIPVGARVGSRLTTFAAPRGITARLAELALHLVSESPRNANGYLYLDYFAAAGISSPNGVFTWTATHTDTFTVDFGGNPLTYMIDTPIASVTVINTAPSTFYSVYQFPDSTAEMWAQHPIDGAQP